MRRQCFSRLGLGTTLWIQKNNLIQGYIYSVFTPAFFLFTAEMDREVTWTMKHPCVCVWIHFGRDTEQLILCLMLCSACVTAVLIHPESSWASSNTSPFTTRPFLTLRYPPRPGNGASQFQDDLLPLEWMKVYINKAAATTWISPLGESKFYSILFYSIGKQFMCSKLCSISGMLHIFLKHKYVPNCVLFLECFIFFKAQVCKVCSLWIYRKHTEAHREKTHS